MAGEANKTLASTLTSQASNAKTSNSLPFPNPDTVKGRVLGTLLAGEHITGLDCLYRFGGMRLSSAIHSLRHECGWPIIEVDVEVVTADGGRKAIVGSYHIPLEVIEQFGEQGQKYAEECARVNAERRVRHGRE